MADAAGGAPPRGPTVLRLLGPGLITGASDDDPSGIATYSQAGAQFGFQFGWVLLFSWPLMCAVQEIAARIGAVTGRGIAGNLRAHAPRPVLLALVGLLVVANVLNLGADLGAMAAALALVIGGPHLLYVALFALASLLLEVFVRYGRYVSVLKWLTLSLFAYVGVAFMIDMPWGEAARGVLVPTLTFSASELTVVVAMLGTTISPYLFFWQAESEVEDARERPGAWALLDTPVSATAAFRRIRLDTVVGMGVSNLVALFIVLTTAATLHAHGVTDIETSAQAAEALRPIAGQFVFAVFALGIVGTGLLAVPVLAGSCAYAVGEALGWPVGLARTLGSARAFYAVLAAAFVVGAALSFTPLDPIKALFWCAVINGVVAVPIMAAMLILAGRRDVMGALGPPRPLVAVGWTATAVMAAAAVGMVALA